LNIVTRRHSSSHRRRRIVKHWTPSPFRRHSLASPSSSNIVAHRDSSSHRRRNIVKHWTLVAVPSSFARIAAIIEHRRSPSLVKPSSPLHREALNTVAVPLSLARIAVIIEHRRAPSLVKPSSPLHREALNTVAVSSSFACIAVIIEHRGRSIVKHWTSSKPDHRPSSLNQSPGGIFYSTLNANRLDLQVLHPCAECHPKK
jgi:hypothetical protein